MAWRCVCVIGPIKSPYICPKRSTSWHGDVWIIGPIKSQYLYIYIYALKDLDHDMEMCGSLDQSNHRISAPQDLDNLISPKCGSLDQSNHHISTLQDLDNDKEMCGSLDQSNHHTSALKDLDQHMMIYLICSMRTSLDLSNQTKSNQIKST